MKYGLKDEIIEKMKVVFAGFPQIEEVIIYGSRTKGNFKPGSDIDLAVKGNMNLMVLNKISLALDDLMFPYIIDMQLYNYIKSVALLEHIDRVGNTIYKKSKILVS